MLSLNERERQIIEIRFGVNSVENKELTQKEVADILGISQSYISRLEKKIMERLKKEIPVSYTHLVKINNPKGGAYYGGTIAAPVASEIFREIIPYAQEIGVCN